MIFEDGGKERLTVYELDEANHHVVFDIRETDMTFIWNTGDSMDITIDKVLYHLQKHQVIFLTEFHKIDSISLHTARMVRFNQPFYCIVNHDNEVGSKGLLFFGASGVPIVSIKEDEVKDFELSWEIFSAEMRKADILQKTCFRLCLSVCLSCLYVY